MIGGDYGNKDGHKAICIALNTRAYLHYWLKLKVYIFGSTLILPMLV